jgi:hypothetical protein
MEFLRLLRLRQRVRCHVIGAACEHLSVRDATYAIPRVPTTFAGRVTRFLTQIRR